MKKCVIVGTGHRGLQAYVIPIAIELADCINLCGAYDKNPKRAALASEFTNSNIPVYEDFDKMIKETNPDIVLITSMDSEHDKYIIKALEAGCGVITEKPITTDEVKFNAIYEAEKRTGKKVLITFNCRFLPFYVRIKQLMLENIIGDILSVHYEYFLDTTHGADYFRRWHRERKNSGSLLIHKATHHFDLLNWIIYDDPEKVSAFGTRRFYGPTRVERSERCLTCPYKNTCEFYYDMTNDEFAKKVYLECEDVDGYLRDKCVFSEEIDIEDSVSAIIKYKKGAVVSYSLTAHSPHEGFKMVLNGTEGRMEITRIKNSGSFSGNEIKEIKIYNRQNEEITYKVPKDFKINNAPKNVAQLTIDNLAGHGGADPLMRAMLFRGYKSDPLHQISDTRAGAMSIGIGIAANKSMAENRIVEISELFNFLREDEKDGK